MLGRFFGSGGLRPSLSSRPPSVVGLRVREQPHQRRNCDHDDPRSMQELAGQEHDHGDRGHRCAGRVERCAQPPARRPRRAPVSDQADLADRQPDEHADREHRDQGVRLAVDGDQQNHPGERKRDDSVAVYGLLGAQVEHVRKPVVLGEQVHQHRQATEARVGGEREHRCHRQVGHVVGPSGSEGSGGDLRQHRHPVARDHVVVVDQQRQADEHRAEQHPERDLGDLRVAHTRPAERGDAVGDRLDAGHGGAAGRKGAEHQDDRERLMRRGVRRADDRHRVGVKRADDDHREHARDEQHGRPHQQLRRFADPEQVDERQQEQADEADGQQVRGHPREDAAETRRPAARLTATVST